MSRGEGRGMICTECSTYDEGNSRLDVLAYLKNDFYAIKQIYWSLLHIQISCFAICFGITTFFISFQKASPLAALATRAQYSTESTDLREVMAQKIPAMQEEVKAFRKEYGNTKVGEITVDMVSGSL